MASTVNVDTLWVLLAAFLVFFMQAGFGMVEVRLEIAVNENFVKRTVDAIIKGARTGQIGDGKIFVVDLPQCIRIRTGEEGSSAIG